jgi:TolB-like protein
MADFFAELKRRHIYRVGAAYVVVAWVLTQVVDILSQVFALPAWIARPAIVLLVIGFPIALVAAWMIESKPHEAIASAVRSKPTVVDWTLCGALALVILLIGYQQIAPRRPAGPPGAAISLAVLPFANVSGDASRDFFSDGMTDEISGALAKIRDLRVIARTSAFQFKGQSQDVRAVGQALGASHLIEGSVRQAGNRVRITAQLVRAGDGVQLWSENYDRELTDIFAIQEDIAQAIAGALRVPLGLAQGETLIRNRTVNLDSYQQYLRARALRRETRMPEAIAILEPVVARDPTFAPAWSLLANVYRQTAGYVSTTDEEFFRLAPSYNAKAENAAREAIRLDSREALAYAVLAQIEAASKNWIGADDLYRQALGFDPNEPDVLHSYSLRLAAAGRIMDALGVREKLRTLEPIERLYNVWTGSYLQVAGQNRAAVALLESIPTTDAAIGFNRNVILAAAYAAEGRFADAADTLLAITGNRVSRGMVEDAAQLLRSAPARVSAPDRLPALDAGLNFVYVYVGAPDRVLDDEDKFLAAGNAFLDHRVWSADYTPIRQTERFKALIRNAGLLDYWRARGWPDLCRPVGADDFVCD